MASGVSPTKGNLLKIKKSLQLARVGYELLDRKRNILIREMMSMIDNASSIQVLINEAYNAAYKSLQLANIDLGIVDNLAAAVPVENGIELSQHSVMGVVIPTVKFDPNPKANYFGYYNSSVDLDEAYSMFDRVKRLTASLAEIENGVYRLAQGIKKTQKRANALKNIIIPKFENQVKFITSALEEKEREEFARLKIIKKIID